MFIIAPNGQIQRRARRAEDQAVTQLIYAVNTSAIDSDNQNIKFSNRSGRLWNAPLLQQVIIFLQIFIILW